MSTHSTRAYRVHQEASKRQPKNMMSLADMLNPVDERGPPSPVSAYTTDEPGFEPGSGQVPAAKKQKIAKDAPIFAEGKPIGQVRYRPHESFGAGETAEMAKFGIYPAVGSITLYPRHIPYSSDKKNFLEKTGREAFEVFQYTFKIQSDERTHTVMWDYNVGLVRITPFFKCCRYAKMLGSNPGLKEICHSITGGALAAQGYWMPYEAAKALAATFCYHIRYALLPLFGSSFASQCARPGDEGFGQMVIDRAVIDRCSREAAVVRRETAATSQPSNGYCSDTYRGFSPTPTGSEASTRASTPRFFEPRYTVSGSSCGPSKHRNGKPRPGAGRHIAYVCERWATPDSPSSGERERRNGIGGGEGTMIYLPSPTSNHSSCIGRPPLAVNGGIPRSRDMALPPIAKTPLTIGSFRSVRFHEQPVDRPPTVSSDSSSSGSATVSSYDKSISPKTKPSEWMVSYTDSNAADQDLPSMTTVANSNPQHNAEGLTGSRASSRHYKAAWQLWQLHMADANLRLDRIRKEQVAAQQQASVDVDEALMSFRVFGNNCSLSATGRADGGESPPKRRRAST